MRIFATKKSGGSFTYNRGVLSYRLKYNRLKAGLPARYRSPLSVCCLFVLHFTIKGTEERTEKKQGNTAEKLRHNNIIYDYKMGEKKQGKQGKPPRLWKSPPYIILKKYKKPIDKSENVCYNRGKVEAKPSESIKKESGKNRYIIIIKTPKGKE